MWWTDLVGKAWKALAQDTFICTGAVQATYMTRTQNSYLNFITASTGGSKLTPEWNQITVLHSCFSWLSIKNCPLAEFPLMSHIVVSEEFPTCFNGMAGEISSCHLRTWYSAAIAKDSCRFQHVFTALFHITEIITFLLTVTKETGYLVMHCLLLST